MLKQTSLRHILVRFLKPEIEELVVYIALMIGLISYAFYEYLKGDRLQESTDIFSTVTFVSTRINDLLQANSSSAAFFTFAMWFIIGSLLYAAAWFMIGFLQGAYKDISVSNSYVHPRSYSASKYWLSIVAKITLQLFAAISLLLYLTIVVSSFVPAWVSSFKNIFTYGFEVSSVVGLLITITFIGIVLHLGSLLMRLALLRSKYFYNK